MIALVGDFLILGIVIGGIYALFSIGLTLIFGVLDIINVAHGELFTFGGYLTFIGISLLALSAPTAFLGAVVGSFFLGVAIYLLLVAPLHRHMGRRPKGPIYLVLTLGLSTFLQNSMLAVAGAEYKRVPSFLQGILFIFNTPVSKHRLLVLGVATAILLALFLFLKHSRLGMAIRAVAQNPEAAQSLGIPLGIIYALTFGIGAALAGAGGSLIAPVFRVYPTVGFNLTIKAFAITIMGGMGNLLGALLASYIIGISESLAVIFISSEWRDLLAFIIMVLVLIFRPSGLLGKTQIR